MSHNGVERADGEKWDAIVDQEADEDDHLGVIRPKVFGERIADGDVLRAVILLLLLVSRIFCSVISDGEIEDREGCQVGEESGR